MEKIKEIFNKGFDFIKGLKKDEIIICILFIIITIFSVLSFGWLGLISLPIMGGLIYVYYNPKKITRLFGKKGKKRAATPKMRGGPSVIVCKKTVHFLSKKQLPARIFCARIIKG